jgi:zinc protease
MRKAPGVLTCLVLTIGSFAQDKATTPSMTGEEVLERNIQATGGRERREKITSSVTKGTVTMTAQSIQGSVEVYHKAPNKKLVVTTIAGFGEVKNGFDGQIAWTQNPNQPPRELEGTQRANSRRDALFNSELKWREIYSKVESAGIEKAGDREFYVVRITPLEGAARTVYYDTRTFLMDHAESVIETPQGTISLKTYISDYRDVDGVKAPFEVKQSMPSGDIVIKLTEIKYNVDIDDAKFAKPGK